MVKLLQREGWTKVRQRGDHVTLHKEDRKTVIPLHKELKTGTLSAILDQAGISKAEFERLKRP